MSHLITITFSPCIDKSTSVASLIPEKKLKCSEPKLEPGGGGINVARAIKKLGGNAIAIFPSGGYSGKHFNYLVEKENISSIIIETVNETRENFIVLDESTNKQYRLGMPGTALDKKEWQACIQACQEIKEAGFIVASGSLPPGVPHSIFAELARIAKQKNAKLVVDTSGEALLQAAKEPVYLLKPNLGELSTLAGVEIIDTNHLEKIAKEVLHKMHCEVLVVSLGSEGAVLVTKDNFYRAVPPTVERKSTVGAGDSMVAGIIYSLDAGKGLEEALQYGVACGTAATLRPGTELCDKKDADRLFGLIRGRF